MRYFVVHRFRRVVQYYIHLHRGITISNTSRHLAENHRNISQHNEKIFLLGIEKGQTRLEERLSNVRQAFNCQEVFT